MKARTAAIGVVVIGGLVAIGLSAPVAAPQCPTPDRPLRYTAVAPTFAKHCASCHDARKGDNKAAQRVFEMSTYPFATERPDTLLVDLRKMFATRGGLTDDERCRGLGWIDGGGLDADGKRPRWRTR
jgi:hypothetical protein